MKIINPILKGFHPDPSICRVEDDYYIAVSTFEWFPGVQIYHSKDLVNWHLISRPLARTSQLNMLGNPDSGGVWAPCLSYANGRFWLIYSDVKVVEGDVFKDVTNYLVTCESIDGEWSDPIYMNQSGFDPSLFHDEDGRKYFVNMVWDFRPNNHRFFGIVLQEYSQEEKSLVGERKVIFKGTDLGLTEAPHLYKIDGWYYLLTAEGGTQYDHAATIARSRSIEGPYEVHPNNPFLTSWGDPRNPLQKAGHASLVQTKTGDWYLAHLIGRPIKPEKFKLLENRGYCPLGRETALQKIEWHAGWPYVVDGPFPSLEIEAPNIPEVSWRPDQKTIDHFDSERLNPTFQTLRLPFSSEIGSLTERIGFLRLFGRESLHSQFYQALVARRWQAFSFEAETYLEFEPVFFQQFAGLICYYNTQNWVSCHLTCNNEGQKVLSIIACEHFKASAPMAEELLLPEDLTGIYLKVKVEELTYHFSYSLDGFEWIRLAPVFDSWKLSDDYIQQGGYFTGAFVGIHCVDLTGDRKAADFDYFRYEETIVLEERGGG
ncbi:glycoside hydrolase family 43 protein [Enterococcus sp. AD013-P3]|uniref:glycoside hydrolase family 43 protein n=1 Tax=Enterococcus sp. AD013-P3 TaxID=3411036 RepID=UPI003B94FC7E